MERLIVATHHGSPRPPDLFRPHMPDVDELADMPGLFSETRRLLAQGVEEDSPEADGSERHLAIVTPGRAVLFHACPPTGSLPDEVVAPLHRWLPGDEPLDVTVITYTKLEAMLSDLGRCVPFFGVLMGFASVGHNVVLFEGHPSAFATGVQDSDVVLVDSAMLPYLQTDWLRVARRVSRPGARILVPYRDDGSLIEVAGADDEEVPPTRQRPWWRFW
jgi:hypothetical protein